VDDFITTVLVALWWAIKVFLIAAVAIVPLWYASSYACRSTTSSNRSVVAAMLAIFWMLFLCGLAQGFSS
jgi:Kef-type K+ transport system membrane component KefB